MTALTLGQQRPLRATPRLRAAHGNALFIILIAVALFAALSYAVTQSGRGGGSVNKEQIVIKAANMVQYATNLRTAVQRMVLNGTTAANLDLWTTAVYTPCTTGADCIFAAAGGGATSQRLPDLGDMDFFHDGLWRYSEVSDGVALRKKLPGNQFEEIGTTAADAYIYSYITYNTNGKELCTQINKNLGITGIPGDGDNWWDSVHSGAGCASHYGTYYIFYMALLEN